MTRDGAHLDALRDLPCCKCYAHAAPRSEAAHIRLGACAGIARKPDDSRAVPLCHPCHLLQHAHGEIAFWGARLQDAIVFAARLYKASRDEKEILTYRFWKARS